MSDEASGKSVWYASVRKRFREFLGFGQSDEHFVVTRKNGDKSHVSSTGTSARRKIFASQSFLYNE